MIRSALYHGDVMHHRFTPKNHRFNYRLSSWLIDIDELPKLDKELKGFAWNRAAPFSFYDKDYGFADGRSPRAFINDLFHTYQLPIPERVELLCQIRCLGQVFNPLVVWYCYDANDQLCAVLYEVRNTFKQRHHYFVPMTSGSQEVLQRHSSDKCFFVSPFMPMECRYDFSLKRPADQFYLSIQQSSAEQLMMSAVWKGERETLSQRALNKHLLTHPLNTLKIILAIHWEALLLWIKGMRILKRPALPKDKVTLGHSLHSTIHRDLP